MNFFLATFTSLGNAYGFLNSLPADANVHEFGQAHDGQIVVCGETNSEMSSSPKNSKDFISINNLSPLILKAYFKQNSERMNKNLLIIEHSQLSTIFSVAQTLVSQHGFFPLEISRNALPGGSAHGLLINGDSTDLSSIFDESVSWQIINEPSALLKSYF